MKNLFGVDTAGAIFSKAGVYRYDLWRVWDIAKPSMLWVMLNPSTADQYKLDPTLRRCRHFTLAFGCGSFNVANIFALRSTDPAALLSAVDPVGPDNDAHIRRLAANTHKIVVGWGAHPIAKERDLAVLSILKEYRNVYCLGTTKDGYPRHPLYVNGNKKLEMYLKSTESEV